MKLPNNFMVSLHKPPTETFTYSNTDGLILDKKQTTYLKIIKSLVSHITEVEIKLNYLSEEVLVDLQESNLFIKIELFSTENDSTITSSNFFVPIDIIKIESASTNLSSASYQCTLLLESVTLQRMRFENNLSFLGWNSKLDKIGNSGEFFQNIITPIIEKTYFDANAKSTLVSTSSNSVVFAPAGSNNRYNSRTVPSRGYILQDQNAKTENNFDILDYFFSRYSIYLTPYSWLIDDFPLQGGNSTTIRISNFYSSSTNIGSGWLVNNFLSNNIMSKVGNNSVNLDKMMYYNMQHLKSEPFYNTWKFNQAHKNPIFQLIGDEEAQLINTKNINQKSERIFVKDGLMNIGVISNPGVHKIESFLSKSDIQLQKAYKNKFKEFNPKIDTFSFENIPAHNFDMSKAVLFKSTVIKSAQEEEVQRIGFPYNCTFIYTNFEQDQTSETTIIVEESTAKLEIEIDLLTIDDFKDDLNNLVISQSEIDKYINLFISNSSNKSSYGPIRKEYSKLLIQATGSNIADTAQEMQEALPKFRYLWGGATASSGYDCSGYVMTAVCRSTGLQRYGARTNKEGFPKLAETQRLWCQLYAVRVTKEEIQAGDIVFLKSSTRTAARHVGIAKSNTEIFHSSGGQKCSATNTCVGPAIGRINQAKLDQWDRSFYGAYRLTGDGTSSGVQEQSQPVGRFCAEIAKIESTNTGGVDGYDAYNSRTGATGMYQFMEVTQQDIWTRLLRRSGNVPDVLTPELQDEMCIAYEGSIIKSLENHSIPVNFLNVYLSWQQGLSGYRYILQAVQSGSDSGLPNSIIRNMKSNMHGATYVDASSFLKNAISYIRLKGANPDLIG